MRLIAISLALASLLPSVAQAAIWHVPTDPGAATIAEALQNAQPEDRVLVAPGVYYEHDLVVPFGVYLWGDGASPGDVVIDAQGQGRVAAVLDPDAVAVWLKNLTLTGGDADRGGAFYTRGQNVRMTDCRLIDNEANYGGGLFVEGYGTDVINCEIIGNTSRSLGGGLFFRGDARLAFQDCALVANHAAAGAGGWYATQEARLSFATTTVADNRADWGAEGGAFGVGFILVENFIAADNHPLVTAPPTRREDEPPAEMVLLLDQASIPFYICTVRYNGGFTGAIASQEGVIANVTADPRFCRAGSPDDLAMWYGLAADSPALPENSGTCGPVGRYDQACEFPVGVPDTPAGVTFVLHAPFPNPFNPATVISFETTAAGPVRLDVFDLAGRKVATLVENSLAAGRHEAVWRGRDHLGRRVSSGTYICRLIADRRTASRRLTLVK